jgi:hypothetical protein
MASIFLSHSSRDKTAAVRLATDLRKYAHDVWLDQWRIHVGESISAEVERGIQEASFLVLLLSKNAVESSWVEREWRAAYWNELEEKQVIILPALLEPVEVPLLLRDKRYASLFPEYSKGLEEILEALDHHRREQARKSFYAPIAERLRRG